MLCACGDDDAHGLMMHMHLFIIIVMLHIIIKQYFSTRIEV